MAPGVISESCSGGTEGKALVAEPTPSFRKGGAVDPGRFVAAILPGCEIR
jgi:hypothetical protein